MPTPRAPYQRRTPSPSLSAEVDALTRAGAHWHDTPYGVFWTDPLKD